MSKIYKNQSYLTIQASVGINISTATTLQLKYIKPSGATGSWTATKVSNNGIIKYEITEPSPINEAGEWIVWAYVIFSDGRVAPGEPNKFMVYNEGS